MQMRILLTGVSGAIGSELAPELLARGHEVCGLTRDIDSTARARRVPAGVRLLHGDVVTGRGLKAALHEVEVAYYLIHSMEPRAGAELEQRELSAARHFACAAAQAGVRRVVYLGGLLPEDAQQGSSGVPLSAHLASRLAVEQTLLTALPDAVALRASIVIGARSRSFRFLVHLLERLPVLPLPSWRRHRSAPVDERDVIQCLAKAAEDRSVAGRSLDIGGPEVLSYGALIERIRDLMLISRPLINMPGVTLTPIASRVAAQIAGEQHALIGPLMEGLNGDLLPREPLAAELLQVRLHSLDAAIEHALKQWEHREPLRAR